MILRVSFMTLSQNVQHWPIKIVPISPLVTSERILKRFCSTFTEFLVARFFSFSPSVLFSDFSPIYKRYSQRRLGTFLCCVDIDLPHVSKRISFIKYISICRPSRSYIISMTYPKHTPDHTKGREKKGEKQIFYLNTWVLEPIQLIRPSKKC